MGTIIALAIEKIKLFYIFFWIISIYYQRLETLKELCQF